SAQFVSDKTTDYITPLGLRAPEVVLSGEWNESVDIWTFGCMVFTLLTDRALFLPMPLPEHDAPEIDVLLYQMICFCGEFFNEELLQRCPGSVDYFRLDCRSPLHSPWIIVYLTYSRKPFEKCILDSGCVLSPEDMAGITDLMNKCLRIDPKDRTPAFELLRHPWLVL
ncbi:hypothetical protein M413DRAFT_75515, partial [Hebeloma cylindrosporum]